jgi:hypothetical protein
MSVGLEGKQSLANWNHDACTVEPYHNAKVGTEICQITLDGLLLFLWSGY